MLAIVSGRMTSLLRLNRSFPVILQSGAGYWQAHLVGAMGAIWTESAANHRVASNLRRGRRRETRELVAMSPRSRFPCSPAARGESVRAAQAFRESQTALS